MKSIWDVRCYVAVNAGMGAASIWAKRIFLWTGAKFAFPWIKLRDKHKCNLNIKNIFSRWGQNLTNDSKVHEKRKKYWRINEDAIILTKIKNECVEILQLSLS